MAWLYTNLPDPRPSGKFTRGLAHPAEFAANVSYLRELQTLESYHNAQLASDWKGKGKGKGRGQQMWWQGGGANWTGESPNPGEEAAGDGNAAGRARGRGRPKK